MCGWIVGGQRVCVGGLWEDRGKVRKINVEMSGRQCYLCDIEIEQGLP